MEDELAMEAERARAKADAALATVDLHRTGRKAVGRDCY